MIGNIYPSNNFGPFKVIDYKNASKVTIQFLATGYQTITQKSAITRGGVRDYHYKSVCGIGYLGKGKYKSTINRKQTSAYSRWYEIIRRCYHERSLVKHPTYHDCTVDERWHNFQEFAAWFEEHNIEGYELDKDILYENNRVYGPDTCMFVSPLVNIVKAKATSWSFKNPQGVIVNIYNLKKFCRDNNLNDTNMYRVYYGSSKAHKGWTSIESSDALITLQE